MYALGLDGIVLEETVFLFLTAFSVDVRLGIHLRELGGYVGQHEELRILCGCR